MGEYYTVKKGDYLAKIARVHGIHDWRALYEHPANEEFRELRPDPNIIAPGDQLYIPDTKMVEHARATGSRHTFELPVEPPSLHVILRAPSGEPYADMPCTLRIGDETVDTSTDGEGAVRHEDLPLHIDEVTLEIGGRTLTLRVGHLDPCEELSGVQGRLRNLGFYMAECHGELDDPTRDAIRRFKVEHDLGDDDTLDDAVRDRLREEYGA